MADEERRALIEARDILGLEKPLTEAVRLVEAIARGVGSWFEPWLRKRQARASIDIWRQWQKELSPLPTEPVTSVEIELEGRAALRWSEERVRHQRNREKVAIATIQEARDLEPITEEVDGDGTGLDEGWLDRFWRLAQDVSDEDLQRLWGRILLRESRRPGAISPRTLEIVSLLRREDAHELERVARFTCTAPSETGREQAMLVSSINGSEPLGNVPSVDTDALKSSRERIASLLGHWRLDYFAPLGVFNEVSLLPSLNVRNPGAELAIRLGSERYVLRGFRTPTPSQLVERGGLVHLCSGYFWTAIGREILKLMKVAPDPDFVAALREGFELHGLELDGPLGPRA